MRSCSLLRVLPALLVLLPALLVACGSASDLSLSAQISDESLEVEDAAFGAVLSGGFQLRFDLGSEAAGSTQVSPGNFELQTDAGQSLVDLREAMPSVDYPISLQKGESKQVLYTLQGIRVDRAKVCAGPVRIVGSVMDTLKGGTVPLRSGPITPDC